MHGGCTTVRPRGAFGFSVGKVEQEVKWQGKDSRFHSSGHARSRSTDRALSHGRASRSPAGQALVSARF